jgi:hypothetical protein
VLASHKTNIKHDLPHNDHARRRDRNKNRKIDDVKKVKPSPRNMMNMRNDPSSKPVFSMERPKGNFQTKLVTA